jgi:hypothetical protein
MPKSKHLEHNIEAFEISIFSFLGSLIYLPGPQVLDLIHLIPKKAPSRLKRDGAFWVADWTGLEPATSAVTGRHSNQLNYQSVLFFG